VEKAMEAMFVWLRREEKKLREESCFWSEFFVNATNLKWILSLDNGISKIIGNNLVLEKIIWELLRAYNNN
jgi:hypothetical protein